MRRWVGALVAAFAIASLAVAWKLPQTSPIAVHPDSSAIVLYIRNELPDTVDITFRHQRDSVVLGAIEPEYQAMIILPSVGLSEIHFFILSIANRRTGALVMITQPVPRKPGIVTLVWSILRDTAVATPEPVPGAHT